MKGFSHAALPRLSRNKNLGGSLKEALIGGQFRILDRLGDGSFGEVYTGVNVYTGASVAVKVEVAEGHSRVFQEYKIYTHFSDCAFLVGIPHAYFAERVGDYNVVVMELLGPSLEDLFNLCGRMFGVKGVCMIGIQVIQRLQFLHSMCYIHRDIKPENFVMGVGNSSNTVYIIDMGLAKRYRNPVTLKHIPKEKKKSLTGTVRYVSINTHNGIQQSRRDDMEAVAYLLVYFLRGKLPWQGMKKQLSGNRFEHIREVKMATSPEKLTEGYPVQFSTLVAYTRALEFEEAPNYSYCVRLLYEALVGQNEMCDYQYPWLAMLDPHAAHGGTGEDLMGEGGEGGRKEGEKEETNTVMRTKPPTIGTQHVLNLTNATQFHTVTDNSCNDVSLEERNGMSLLEVLRDVYGMNVLP